MHTLSRLFKLASYVALSGWLLLLLLPSWEHTQAAIVGVVVMLLSALYTYLVFFGKRLDDPQQKYRGHFWSLTGVINLFKSPRAVLAGWVHYLAFDLMLGLFIVVNGNHYGIAHWILVPCLLLTLMFGPAGLLLYLLLRMAVSGDYWADTLF
ncbi:ABA4-like family protein [Ferrimonas lipolytica]|uniref:DUF4281 domain-containing protein n=1 Tax=Ferrimonas lipolytica TaxID=2724191 RepID=A0A6H1UHE1_9GAMM|nr:ABA4-like family protein [Ferrimonas lipolytica]QIZ77636.1 DUF4281 domain-containing protein [Ferrimonas lipolytica]